MNRLEWLAVLLAGAAIILQTFLPPVVGLANNGDFPRVIGRFDVGNPSADADKFKFADTRYVVDPKYHYESRFYSSELLLFAAALGLNSVSFDPDIFDMRVMGAVHAGIFLLALYRLLPLLRPFRPALRWGALLLILFAFTDVMYVSYFNSFYMDTAAFLFLLLAVVSFLRALRWQEPADRWLLVVSAVFLITSKTQHFPLGIPIALLLAWKGGLLTPGRTMWFRALACGGVLVATAFMAQRGTPSYYPAMGSYTVIFFELLPKSSDVVRDLKELGLDDTYQRYVGTFAFSSDAGMRDPQFADAFGRRVSYADLARFFVKHPARALEVCLTRLDSAGRQRPPVGNFDRRTGLPEHTESRTLAVWSGLKARIFSEHGGRYLLYALSLALFVTVVAFLRRASLPAGVPIAVAALVAMMLLELLVASFADGLDPERHFSLFSALTDLLLVSGVCLAAIPARRGNETIATAS